MSKAQSSRIKIEKPKISTTTPVVQEVISGKLNETEWFTLLDDAESENYIMCIVEDVLNETMKHIFDNYLRRQLIPFVVCQASEALLKMLELENVFHDIGEPDIKNSNEWQPISLPDSSPIDSWAQGAISKRFEVSTAETVVEEEKVTSASDYKHVASLDISSEEANKVNSHDVPPLKAKPNSVEKHAVVSEKAKGIKETQSKRRVNKLAQRIVKTDRLLKSPEFTQIKDETETLPPKKSSTKAAPPKRIVGSGPLEYDDEGNLISVPRLVQGLATAKNGRRQKHPSTLGPFSQATNVQWTILPQSPTEKTAELQRKRSGREEKRIRRLPSQSLSPQTQQNEKVQAFVTNLYNLSDHIELSAGVSISDGERTRMGPGIPTISQLETQTTHMEEVAKFPEWSNADKPISPIDPGLILQLDAIRLVSRS